VERVAASKVTADEAAEGLLEYIQTYVPRSKRGRMAGNSVHFDRSFLREEPYRMVWDHLSHRIFDVSVLAEAVERWGASEIIEGVPKKKYLHDAEHDILESIAEASYYRDVVFERLSIEQKGRIRLDGMAMIMLMLWGVALGATLGYVLGMRTKV
jgi:oligoribonuclease